MAHVYEKSKKFSSNCYNGYPKTNLEKGCDKIEEMREEEKQQEREGKTLFEHMGVDGAKFEPYKAKMKKIAILLLLGWIGGLIVDTTMNTEIFQSVLPLTMLFIIILKIYTGEKNKQR